MYGEFSVPSPDSNMEASISPLTHTLPVGSTLFPESFHSLSDIPAISYAASILFMSLILPLRVSANAASAISAFVFTVEIIALSSEPRVDEDPLSATVSRVVSVSRSAPLFLYISTLSTASPA